MKLDKIEIEKIQFGRFAPEIDELANKVLVGEKIATSSLHDYYLIGKKKQSKIGDLFSVLNSVSEEVAIVSVENIRVIKFGDISDEFAVEEGDGCLENWLRIHKPYYSKLMCDIGKELNAETLIVCEWFKLV